MITDELVGEIRKHYALNWAGIHGIAHFSRVRENGLRLAEATGANARLVELFAFLHDSRRRNDFFDPWHGARAAKFVRSLEGRFFELTEPELEQLEYACRFHAKGLLDADITVRTCWDADRLDLGRVGKRPKPAKLCTDAARDPAIIAWAYDRSRSK